MKLRLLLSFLFWNIFFSPISYAEQSSLTEKILKEKQDKICEALQKETDDGAEFIWTLYNKYNPDDKDKEGQKKLKILINFLQEEDLLKLINCLEEKFKSIDPSEKRIISNNILWRGLFFDVISDRYRSMMNSGPPGKQAYYLFKNAVNTDPSNSKAWIRRSAAVIGVGTSFWKGKAIKYLELNYKDELKNTISGITLWLEKNKTTAQKETIDELNSRLDKIKILLNNER